MNKRNTFNYITADFRRKIDAYLLLCDTLKRLGVFGYRYPVTEPSQYPQYSEEEHRYKLIIQPYTHVSSSIVHADRPLLVLELLIVMMIEKIWQAKWL